MRIINHKFGVLFWKVTTRIWQILLSDADSFDVYPDTRCIGVVAHRSERSALVYTSIFYSTVPGDSISGFYLTHALVAAGGKSPELFSTPPPQDKDGKPVNIESGIMPCETVNSA